MIAAPLPRPLLTADARELPYPTVLAPYLRGRPDEGDTKRRDWARLLRVLFRNAQDYDAEALGALRELLSRPGGLTHPATAALVLRLVGTCRCRTCRREVLATRERTTFCSDACAGCWAGRSA